MPDKPYMTDCEAEEIVMAGKLGMVPPHEMGRLVQATLYLAARERAYAKRVTPDHITTLAPNEVFVYGANARWAHGAGAARQALRFGAVYGEGPFRGQTYGICTKDDAIETLPLYVIADEVNHFLDFARSRPDLTFLVTAVGCGLANLTPADIAPMFRGAPENVALPQSFWDVLNA